MIHEMNKFASISQTGRGSPDWASAPNATACEGTTSAAYGSALQRLLEPLRTLQNPSLITSIYPLITGESRHEILKSLVLGTRAGGTPVRLCLFGGLDAGRSETVAAAVEVLKRLTLRPSLAQDYAVFGYPCVYPDGFEVEGSRDGVSGELESGRGTELEKSYGLFFSGEYHRIAPNGMIMLRSGAEQSVFFRARVNSKLIAREVVEPVLRRLGSLVSVEEEPVAVYSTAEATGCRQPLDGRWFRPPAVR
ncbi:MAG: hypothetical protein EBS01_16415, partial [Verrucomicrobia bacterium]|nr:hypothetical protein [Verrucomicrobiota bacterium]